ncbi:alpha/beta hydrolase [Anaerolineales bacterium HSG25]|nr:alpha/beta hydrolase [Anaerolineales bacterium HSG25]
MPTITLNDKTILSYDVIGQGAPILFLHGIFVSRQSWQPQLNYFAANHQVITCDLRGHGESGSSADNYNVALLADDLVTLLDSLNIEKVACCGHSFGGMVAQELALRHPERVSRLILAETIHSSWITPFDAAWSMTTRFWMPHFVDIETQLDLFARFFTMYGPSSQQAYAFIRNELTRHNNDPSSTHAIIQASFEFSSRGRLAQITCPTLIMMGQYFVPIYPHACEMAIRIPNAELVTIANAGHVLNWDNPTAFNETVARFVGQNGSG